MNKAEFLAALRDRIKGLSSEDIAERVAFYREAIEDRMEDGLTEEEAVEQMGSVEDIAERIMRDIPAPHPVKPKRQLGAVEIVLLILGSPIWISLIAAGFSVAISLYAVIWSAVISLYAVGVSVAACALAGVVGTVLFCVADRVVVGLALLAMALFCAGFSIFTFIGCKYLTKAAAFLTKLSTKWIVRLFSGKEGKK